MSAKPKVYLTSNVFSPEAIGSNDKITQSIKERISNLWQQLNDAAILKVFNGRFPTENQIQEDITTFNPDILGCHLSHPISSELLEHSKIFAISTSTAGYNHIQRTLKDDILITHTPGVLHETVADYTIALIMANLRNIIDLHNYVWEGLWTLKDKWDLDQNLSYVIHNKTLGIIGMGEIGKEILKRLYPWGVKIVYYDLKKFDDLDDLYPHIEFKQNLEEIFREADIISLHIPLNKETENLINHDLLKLMKQNSLLINTARGRVLKLDDLLSLLEKTEIKINFCFDVFPEEPIDPKTLNRIQKIKERHPDIRIILMPHNASADADTRGKMDILFLEDIIQIIKSSCLNDLQHIHLIPEHRNKLFEKKWLITNYWEKK